MFIRFSKYQKTKKKTAFYIFFFRSFFFFVLLFFSLMTASVWCPAVLSSLERLLLCPFFCLFVCLFVLFGFLILFFFFSSVIRFHILYSRVKIEVYAAHSWRKETKPWCSVFLCEVHSVFFFFLLLVVFLLFWLLLVFSCAGNSRTLTCALSLFPLSIVKALVLAYFVLGEVLSLATPYIRWCPSWSKL